jgi:hypothetical protein
MRRTRVPRPAASLSAFVFAAACGGADGAPGPIPDVEGHYLGTWNLAVESDRVSCPAALTITDQADSVFRTSFELLRRYAPGLGCIDTIEAGVGVVRATGTINALAELVEPMTCTLKEPNVGLTGTVVADSITLSGRYTYRCPQDVVWTLQFAGNTSGAPLPAYPDVTGIFTGTYTTQVPGLEVTCPVTVTMSAQSRDDVAGSYALGTNQSCEAQPAETLVGVVTVDGDLELSGAPPVPPGCTIRQSLMLSGTLASETLTMTGTFSLVCGATVRNLAVVIAAVRSPS